MLPTLVIGLREGLEAALIVGIIAAFLRRQGRRDLLRWVYVGVGAAVLLCIGVGAALAALSANLPQRQQEGLETVVGVLAVVLVTYMVVWMRRHSRELKGQLEGLAADAIGKTGGRAGRAMVAMAFLAVLREGFETVVFLLAAFNATANTGAAAGGAVLGIVIAIGLGYGIYRGGVRLNLSKFFRATGLVLVLVAAGLVVNALHTAHEAGWLDIGQGPTVDLTWLVQPGSVESAVLTGMLGIQAHPVVIEVIGWFAYLVPVALYVAWPPGRRMPHRVLVGTLTGVAVACAAITVALVLAAPAAPPSNPPLQADALSAQLLDRDGDSAIMRAQPQSPAEPGAHAQAATTLTLHHTGAAPRGGLVTDVYTNTATGAAASSLPSPLSYAQVAALNGGRLPLGVRPQAGTSSGTLDVRYTQTTTLTLWVAPATGRIVDLQWRQAVTATAVGTPVGDVPLATPVADVTRALPADIADVSAAAARDETDGLAAAEELQDWAWVAGVVVAAALVALGVVLGLDRTRRQRDAHEPAPATPAVEKPVRIQGGAP
jgi:high-affinity iron transporter